MHCPGALSSPQSLARTDTSSLRRLAVASMRVDRCPWCRPRSSSSACGQGRPFGSADFQERAGKSCPPGATSRGRRGRLPGHQPGTARPKPYSRTGPGGTIPTRRDSAASTSRPSRGRLALCPSRLQCRIQRDHCGMFACPVRDTRLVSPFTSVSPRGVTVCRRAGAARGFRLTRTGAGCSRVVCAAGRASPPGEFPFLDPALPPRGANRPRVLPRELPSRSGPRSVSGSRVALSPPSQE